MEVSGPPMRKCPGVRISPSLGSSDRAVRGLEFKSASIWISMVDSCSYVRMMFPIIFLRMVFVLLIPASQRPAKLGARGGMVTQLIAWFSRYAVISWRFVLLLQNSCISNISFLDPRKFVALSLKIVFGIPRRPMNRFKAAMQASVVSSDTSSI